MKSFALHLFMYQCILIQGVKVLGQSPIHLNVVSDIECPKSRFSSAPVYLTKDAHSYWFAYQNGKNEASILKLHKDLHGSIHIQFPLLSERDQIRRGRISGNQIEIDVLRNNRTAMLYLRYCSDTSLIEIKCDTLFQIDKQFPLQKIRIGSHETGDTLIVWASRELRGYDDAQLLQVIHCYHGKVIKDSIPLFEGSAPLIEVIGSEWSNGYIRLFIRKYDHRAVEKRAFQANYTYGWADVALKHPQNTRILFIQREARYLSGPCFDETENGQVLISGLYGTQAKHKIKGYFHYLDSLPEAIADTLWIQPNYHEFGTSFWTDHKRKQRWTTQIKRSRLDDFYLEQYFLDHKNEYVFQLQQIYVTDGGSFSRPQVYFHYKDHIIYTLDITGNIKWYVRIPCNQVLYEPFIRYGGSSLFRDGSEQLVLFQNEHPKNKVDASYNRKMKGMTRPQNGVLRVYFIENGMVKGKVTAKLTHEKKAHALSSSALKIQNGKYLVFYESEKHLIPAYLLWD